MSEAQQNYAAIMRRCGGIAFSTHCRNGDHAGGNTRVAWQDSKAAEHALEAAQVTSLQQILERLYSRCMLG